MKFSQNQLILAGMIIGIIVLGSILAWILFNQEDSGIGISLPKAFAQELHDGLQTELELNQALVDDLDDLPIPEDAEQFYLLQNIARSYQRELEWLTERETISYEALVGTENNLTAQNALQKEIAYYVLFQYLFEINIKTTYDITETGFDMDETIRLTNQEISIIEAVPLLPSSMLEEFAQDSGLSQEQIQNGIKETLEAFLDFKKNEFQESVTRYEQAVMGHQLLTWQFTLQAIAMQTT